MPHVCDHKGCGKSFPALWPLTRHKLTHTHRQPFKCVRCGERFNQSNNLKRHERTQHRTEEHKIEEPNQGAASTVQPPHPLGVVPPSSAAALPNVSLPAGVQVMVLSSSGLVDWSSSLWPSAAQQLHPPTDGIPSAMVEVAPAAAAGATNAMESEVEEMAASAALLLLMGEKDPDGEVEGAIAESEAIEIPEEAEVGSTEGAIEESEALEGVGEGDEGQVSHNLTLVGGLVHPPCLNSLVMPLSVSEEYAKICAEHLTDYWKDGSLVLYEMGTCKRPCTLKGFATYPKTLQDFNVEEQRLATLMILRKDLKRVRVRLPGFFAIEEQLRLWLEQRFAGAFELWRAHVLRQGPNTLRSTGFSVHRDTEENKSIEFTIVVKLTMDEEDEAPSSMRVVGAPCHFTYGPRPGASGCFLADLYHASVPWTSTRDHLKIAFFFRKSISVAR